MNPFDSWYSTNVAPQLAATLKAVPVAARPQIEKASREQMAACWNRAIEEARRWMAAPADETTQTELMANYLRVTP